MLEVSGGWDDNNVVTLWAKIDGKARSKVIRAVGTDNLVTKIAINAPGGKAIAFGEEMQFGVDFWCASGVERADLMDTDFALLFTPVWNLRKNGFDQTKMDATATVDATGKVKILCAYSCSITLEVTYLGRTVNTVITAVAP